MAEVVNDLNLKVMEPRSYQLEILEYVTQRNAIVYLPTGSGKTYVAILALKRYSHEMQRSLDDGGKRAIFMCNTVELARQQALAVREQTNLTVGLFVGERGIDSWEAKRWDAEIYNHQVLVGTAQSFVNMLQSNYIKLSQLSIVIIDECHNGTKNHPMHEFMAIFKRYPTSQHPRVVGLTGVLLKSNKLKTVNEELKTLEATYRGNIVTVRTMEAFENVMIYSTKPKENLITYNDMKSTFSVETRVKQIVDNCKKCIDAWNLGTILPKYTKSLMQLREPNKKNVVKNSLNDFLYQVEDLGVYAASFAILNCIVEFEIKQRQAETIALRQMYRYVVSCCEQIRHLLIRKLLDLCDDEESNAQLSSADNKQLHCENTILNFSTPKLVALLNRIRTVFKGRAFQDISALVFVERRSSAKCLYNVILMWINAVPELRDVLRPSFMVGRNATFVASIENALERKWTLKAIEEFRQGICNMIVTSSVLEEGIDVQACNFVIAFDKLKTFSSYVQTKGRARQTNSQYDIFSSHINQHTTLRQIKEYQEVHNAIREYLMRRLIQTNGPEQRDIDSEFRDIIPPYTIASGAFLNATSSVQMLHRYCQMLPIDSYGAVNADFKITITSDGKYVVSVRLPLQSPVRDIINGDPMSTPKAAKASAALKACARLHQNGELNEKLLPVSKTECVKKVSDQFFSLWKKYDVDTTVNKKKLGFNHQRDYKKLYPNEFINSMPEVGKKCYAYEINMKAGFECNNYTEHLYNLLQQQQNRNYAILLNKPLPALAEMQLFMNQGKVLVRISAQPIEMIIENDVKLQQLVTYHTMIFREILNLWQNRDFLVIDRRNQENSLLVVPLQNQQIDWQLVTQFQHLNGMRAYSPQERSQMIYRPEDYEGSVISKWYVGNQDQRFIVTRVCHELTTESDCDIAQYKSYKHFFESKYGNEIGRVVQPQQFLIEVRELTSRRNFFVNAKSKVNVLRDTSIIRLIPELCHNFLYPGVMWMKALLLPAILHRTHYMLQAEYIRKSINSYLGFANNPNFVNYKPQALIVDQSLKRAVDNDGNAEVMIEEKKITLNPLPAKTATTGYQITSLSNSSDWKEYLEPINVKNETMNIYGVDVNYYYKFISGLALEFDKLNLDEEDLWEKTQFEMPNYVEQCELPSNGAPALAMLNDVPLAEKRRINILERTLGRQPMKSAEQHEFLAALTTSSASDMFDMERFEVLGDAFLKFSVSIYLINKFPTWNEGYLTAVKGQLVSNRNLLYCMSEKDFAQRMYNQIFRPNFEWLPPLVSIPANILQLIAEQPELMREADASSLFSLRLTEDEVLSGKCVAENIAKFKNNCSATNTLPKSRTDDGILDYVYHQTFYDKTVADLMEALIGVCVQNYGFRHCFRLLNYFGIINEPHLDELLDKTLQTRLIRADISPREVDGFLINYPALEKNLGYTFRNRAYLLQALTHPSHPTNRLTGCYQELEFLGDAILDFFVSCYIFERNTHLTPGKLTDLRSALVNNITLGCICVRHRFHLFMLAENASLSDAVKSFAQFQETQKHCVTDQVRILMEEPVHGATDDGVLKKFNIAANVDVPKALGDIVEAIIAAVYLDSKDLETTWHVIYHLLEKELIEFSRNVPIDAVRALYEHKHAQPEFSDPVPEEDIVMVKCSFRCVDEVVNVNGFGINKEQAKKAAAKHALQILAKFSS